MRIGSLFSGIGGFDLGLERAGMTVAWQCERDPAAASVLRRHWPHATLCDDVTTLRGADVEPVDLICGGFPCQDLSVAGQRRGLAGGRSGLWFEFHRILGEIEPDWCVVENVPGLLSSHGGRDFAVLLHGLGELGYRVAWRVLDAQFFGLAQRRQRVFVVGHRRDGRAAEVLFESESLCRDSAPRRTAGESAAATLRSGSDSERSHGKQNGTDRATLIAGCVGGGNYGAGNLDEGVPNMIAHSLRGRSNASHREDSHREDSDTYIAHALRADGFDASEDGTGRGTPLLTFDPRNVTSKANRTRCEPGLPANTMHGGAQSIASELGVRRLMPTECEALQGFPRNWTAEQSDSARYRQLGNAVAVPVAEWIGRRIAESEAAHA